MFACSLPRSPGATGSWRGACRAFLATLLTLTAGCRGDVSYDLVLSGGRVMDPETGLDATRNVGIRDGRIEAISEAPLTGARVIDVSGHVVAPGFIDLHEHGALPDVYDVMVRDGVTSAFELEVGTADVEGWYAERAGGQRVNHGVSVGHIPIRMAMMDDPGDFLPAGSGGSQPASDEQILEMADRIREGLAQGAVAVGMGLVYTPATTESEMEAVFAAAAEGGASVHVHVRGGRSTPGAAGGLVGLEEAIRVAHRTGAALHVVHANSSGGDDLAEFLARIEAVRGEGLDVTTEAYPYGAGMTRIESAQFDDWESWPDERFGIHQWVETGERLTRESFGRYRAQGGGVIIHGRSEAQTRAAIEHPLTMIASDGFMENGQGHPRTAGSYSKVLGRYVRDEGALSLMDALRKMTLDPARRLEGRVPAMASKGRLQVGADADVVVFDPETVHDRATYTEPALPPDGIPFVIVNGVPAVDGGALTEPLAGRAIRAPVEGR